MTWPTRLWCHPLTTCHPHPTSRLRAAFGPLFLFWACARLRGARLRLWLGGLPPLPPSLYNPPSLPSPSSEEDRLPLDFPRSLLAPRAAQLSCRRRRLRGNGEREGEFPVVADPTNTAAMKIMGIKRRDLSNCLNDIALSVASTRSFLRIS